MLLLAVPEAIFVGEIYTNHFKVNLFEAIFGH